MTTDGPMPLFHNPCSGEKKHENKRTQTSSKKYITPGAHGSTTLAAVKVNTARISCVHSGNPHLASGDVALREQGFVERHEAELSRRRARAVVVPSPRSLGHLSSGRKTEHDKTKRVALSLVWLYREVIGLQWGWGVPPAAVHRFRNPALCSPVL